MRYDMHYEAMQSKEMGTRNAVNCLGGDPTITVSSVIELFRLLLWHT